MIHNIFFHACFILFVQFLFFYFRHLRTRSTTPTNNLKHQQLKQESAGLWHELSWELGVRNSLLLLLGLLGLSFYVAYILTGMHRGINIRIPIDGHSDSFKIQI